MGLIQLRNRGDERLPGKVNYFIGNDPKKWQTDVPSYSEVRYHGDVSGSGFCFLRQSTGLEYDFIIAPGADPESIALDVQGAQKLQINSKGNVAMRVRGGEVELQKPAVYQEIDGEAACDCRELPTLTSNQEVRFSVAGYDRTRPLTIDPVLTYSTYIGGEALDFATWHCTGCCGGCVYCRQYNVYKISVDESSLSDSTSGPFAGHRICLRIKPSRDCTSLFDVPWRKRKYCLWRRSECHCSGRIGEYLCDWLHGLIGFPAEHCNNSVPGYRPSQRHGRGPDSSQSSPLLRAAWRNLPTRVTWAGILDQGSASRVDGSGNA